MSKEQRKRVRRKHRNSKLGCVACKKSRIKCGEELDSCYNCLDRNIKCSFLELSLEDKQKIIDNNLAKEPENPNTSSPTPELKDSDLSWVNGSNKGNFHFYVDNIKFSSPGNASSRPTGYTQIKPIKFSSKVNLGQKATFKIAKTNNNNNNGKCKRQRGASGKDKQNINGDNQPSASALELRTVSPALHSSSNEQYKPLPCGETVNASFHLLKNVPQVARIRYSKAHYAQYKACGEGSPIYGQFRMQMYHWYIDLMFNATKSFLLYHAVLSHSGYILLSRIAKAYYADRYPKSHLAVITKFSSYHRGVSFQLSNQIIEDLNTSKFTNPEPYLHLVSSILSFSTINNALTFFADKEYMNLLPFSDQFLSIVLSTQSSNNFSKYLDQVYHTNRSLYEEKFLYKMLFTSFKQFFSAQINSIYIPNYNFDLLRELQEDLAYYNQFTKHYVSPNIPSALQFDELNNFLTHEVLYNQELHSKKRQGLFSEYEPETTFHLLRNFLNLVPSECVFFISTYKSVPLFERIGYLYFTAAASLMKTMFNENQYLFMCGFDGMIYLSGFDVRIYQSIFDELDQTWKHRDYNVYQYLYRKIVYLSRVISFSLYRWRTYRTCLEVFENYPDFLKGQARFLSRKYLIAAEEQIHSLKNTRIDLRHYPRNDSTKMAYLNSTQGPERPTAYNLLFPNSPEYAKFHDTNFHINRNINESAPYKKDIDLYLQSNHFSLDYIPIEFLTLTEYGLLENIDFRPGLNIRPDYKTDNIGQFITNEHTLFQYNSDRFQLLNYTQ